jgi:hypothetical protein
LSHTLGIAFTQHTGTEGCTSAPAEHAHTHMAHLYIASLTSVQAQSRSHQCRSQCQVQLTPPSQTQSNRQALAFAPSACA